MTASTGPVESPGPAETSPPSTWVRMVPWLVPVALAVLFAGIAGLTRWLAAETEERLLREETDQAATALALSVNQIEASLEIIARSMTVVDDERVAFEQLATALLREREDLHRFVLLDASEAIPIATAGTASTLLEVPGAVEALIAATSSTDGLVVVDLLAHGRNLGYAAVVDAGGRERIVYAERTLSPDPSIRRRTDEPFSRIDYALYLDDEDAAGLLGASSPDLPFDGRRASASVPFGDHTLLLVATPIDALGGELLQHLWWVALAGGAVVVVSSRRVLVHLDRSRSRAVALADELDHVHRQQRQIAETLQLALLPRLMEPPPGCSLAVRYWPANSAALVGGDFYDVFSPDDRRWIFVIGDVCGHGVDAAALTGLVRHTLRGSARHVASPSEMLRTVHEGLHGHDPTTFTTICLGSFTASPRGGGRLTLALAGHPQPLLRRADGRVEAIGAVGTVLGMVAPRLYDTEIEIAPDDVLLFFTDGLTDAPADQGVPLDEVAAVLAAEGGRLDPGPLADTIRGLKRRRRPRGSVDDTALLVLRFGDPTTGVEVADLDPGLPLLGAG